MEEISLIIDEAKLKKMTDEMLDKDVTWSMTSVSTLIDEDFLQSPEKIVLSLHKFPAIVFNDDDIEERTSRWVNKCIKKFNPYARYGVENWKNPHAKIFYIRRQKEPGRPKEEIYSNSKIVQVIKTFWELGHEHKFITKIVPDYANTGLLWSLSVFIRSLVIWERVHDFQLGIESYQQKINLTAPIITFPGIEEYDVFSIIYEPVHGIIYTNSKKEKRYGYVQKELTNDEVEFLKLFVEEIKVRLNYPDQIRRWEIDVKFYENIFPFKKKYSNDFSNSLDKSNKSVNGLNESKEHNLNIFDVQSPIRPYDEEGDNSNMDGNIGVTFDDCNITVEDEVAGVATQIKDNVTYEGNVLTNQNGEGLSKILEISPMLQKVMTVKFIDFVVNSSVRYGIEKYVCYANLSSVNHCFSDSINKSTERKTFHEACQNPKWVEAMNLEIEALFRNNTYVLVDLPPGRKAIGCKWIWKIKYKSSDEIDRYKARLVANGVGQREGIDYEETFSHVVKMLTVRCLIALSVQNNWPLFQLDVNNAFLYGDLKEEVYMELPHGYYDKNETKVCKLVKSLYGLKQAPRQWNEKLTTTLIENGFVQSKNDYSLYVKKKYCLELLSEYGFLACKLVATPLQQNVMLSYEESKSDKFLSNMTEYKKSAYAFSLSISLYCSLKGTSDQFYKGVDGLLPARLYCDSSCAISIAENLVFHEKTKHFEIDLHLVRKKVPDGIIKVLKVASASNVADVFTKGLGIAQHNEFCKKLRLVYQSSGAEVNYPALYKLAYSQPRVEAMNLEIEALFRNNTYVLVDLPLRRKAIGCKWIWKIKYKSSCEIDRYKVRLVANGFGQREGIDYEETFSHVVKMVTVRCLIALSVPFNDIFIAILVYVDDIMVTENNENEIDKFKKFLSSKFMIKDMGLLKYFLGIEVLENENGLCLSQRKYCLELLSEYGLLACKPTATPLLQNVMLSYKESESDKFLSNMTECQKVFGKLIYLYITRLDISYVVHCLSQHMHASLQSHFTAALKKQATIYRSLVESEYRCLASTTCEIIWVIKVLKDLGLDGLLPRHLYCDSSSAISIARNLVFHEKTKHFEIDLHLVREKVSDGIVKVLKVASDSNVADVFTKGLSIAQHNEFCKKTQAC
ncbi:ribonuclease H-like domain-containing protein [Tanacetum coccineum]|uniref:Ribonuclease H-like domain-containing protein n=1 Tax=Tanacetum coccineum TaxID=301880 RepID=A0ABQ4ZUM0_9ASTR